MLVVNKRVKNLKTNERTLSENIKGVIMVSHIFSDLLPRCKNQQTVYDEHFTSNLCIFGLSNGLHQRIEIACQHFNFKIKN